MINNIYKKKDVWETTEHIELRDLSYYIHFDKIN